VNTLFEQVSSEDSSLEEIQKNSACYVLISCDEPNADGNMQVKMTYQGNATLASLLLHGAQTYIEEHEDEESEFDGPINVQL